MTEQENTIILAIGLLHAAIHLLDASRGESDHDDTLREAADTAMDCIGRGRRSLSRAVSQVLTEPHTHEHSTPKGKLVLGSNRTLSSDMREDR
jgi:hypothetical protein